VHFKFLKRSLSLALAVSTDASVVGASPDLKSKCAQKLDSSRSRMKAASGSRHWLWIEGSHCLQFLQTWRSAAQCGQESRRPTLMPTFTSKICSLPHDQQKYLASAMRGTLAELTATASRA